MVASKREHSVHVRVCDEADAVLELIASASARDKAAVAADLLHRALLGEGHSVKVAALRFARAGLIGTDRE
jgi:hypothetical protein